MLTCSTALESHIGQPQKGLRAVSAVQLEDTGGAFFRCARQARRVGRMLSPKKRTRAMRPTPDRVKAWGLIERALELWPGSYTQRVWPGQGSRPAKAARPAKRADVLTLVNGLAVGMRRQIRSCCSWLMPPSTSRLDPQRIAFSGRRTILPIEATCSCPCAATFPRI